MAASTLTAPARRPTAGTDDLTAAAIALERTRLELAALDDLADQAGHVIRQLAELAPRTHGGALARRRAAELLAELTGWQTAADRHRGIQLRATVRGRLERAGVEWRTVGQSRP